MWCLRNYGSIPGRPNRFISFQKHADYGWIPSLVFNGHRRWGSFLRVQWPGREDTAHLHLVLRLQISGAVLLLLHIPILHARLLSSGIKMNKWSIAPAVCTSTFCVVSQHLHRHDIHQLRLLTEQSHISRPICVGPTLSSVLYITWKFYQH